MHVRRGFIQMEAIPEQVQAFWIQWVYDAFPDLDSSAYFLPSVYLNRVPLTRDLINCHHIQVRNVSVQDSDSRHDAAMQNVLFCLQKMAEENREVLVGISKVKFGEYLGEPSFATSAAHFPTVKSSLPEKLRQGTFSVLLIHRQYAFVVFEVMSVGYNMDTFNISEDEKNIIKNKLKKAVSILEKAEKVLSHLVSDIVRGLRITKVIAVPNLTSHQVQAAISGDHQLCQDLCQCLGIQDPADIPALCLCSDQLSDPKTPWNVSSDVLRDLQKWWMRRVSGHGPDSKMTSEYYKKIVARFCGPATTVTVPCVSVPRLCVKTLGEAVSWTGECYAVQLTLFPEQVHMVQSGLPKVFLTGPPGTGKTVVLQLVGTGWLENSKEVHIVSTWAFSRAPSYMLYHLLKNHLQGKGRSTAQLHLWQYDLDGGKDVENAVDELFEKAKEGCLYIIADEAGPYRTKHFITFFEMLLLRVPRLHLWAANCYCLYRPSGWLVEELTRPLRSPPAVVREVGLDTEIARHHDVHKYSPVPSFTDGPPVKRLYHKGQGHSERHITDCVTCGRDVATFLNSLRITKETNQVNKEQVTDKGVTATPPPLRYKDVLVLYWKPVTGDSGVVSGLGETGIPVRVMTDDDIEDVAMARSDVVWVANGYCVRGLERKIIVCLDFLDVYVPLRSMSRCSSQLVIVSE